MTLSALGIFSAAGAGAVSAGSYELISSTILSGTAGSVDFTGLSTYSADYRHLQIRYVARNTAANVNVLVTFNGISTASYARHGIEATISAIGSDSTLTQNNIRIARGVAGSATSNTFTPAIIDILDAYSTTKNKTLRAFHGTEDDDGGWLNLSSGFLNNTAAISSILLTPSGGSFQIGSRFSIYGIR